MRNGNPTHERIEAPGFPSPEEAALAAWGRHYEAEVLGVRMNGPFLAMVSVRLKPDIRMRNLCIRVQDLWYVGAEYRGSDL
jgi:hypothetical protein